ncbi:class I SAM-dependent methyltransferase [Sphaerothrix gracilis]|uniref:class I SAM-dependent methyltransferase n=1 Tax=Sphaerothrix gracilis TaxID=3151835 RepID=UPI0031FCA205
MTSFERSPASFYSQELSRKKTWYSAVAAAYDKARPRYPQPLIRQAIALAKLSLGDCLLELGCGPGTATTDFAQLGLRLVCLEPSRSTYALACQNCQPYPAVSIINTTFEEWPLPAARFDAVLAANAFHWISADVRHAKAFDALKPGKSLVLLWNIAPQLEKRSFQAIAPILRNYEPGLAERESIATHLNNMGEFGKAAIGSGYFHNLQSEWQIWQTAYSVEDYLLLLSTLSPYIALPDEQRQALFADLKVALEAISDRLAATGLSALQVMQKVSD